MLKGQTQLIITRSKCAGLAIAAVLLAHLGHAAAAGGGLLPAERATIWNPGLAAKGGIPERQNVCAHVKPLGPGRDDTARIQGAINICPFNQVVELAEGTFLINGGHFVLLNKGITLRGAGPDKTILAKIDGAKPFQEAVGPHPSPLVVVGPSRFSSNADNSNVVYSVDLSADAAAGAYEVSVGDPSHFKPGQVVLLDEASGAGWQPDPQGRGQIWASPDWRVVWQKHDPAIPFVDDFKPEDFPATPQTAGGWFSRTDRPTAEIKVIESISKSVIRFTTPVHISYRTKNKAQLSRYAQTFVSGAGVENLKLTGGDNGNLRFHWAAFSWAKNIDVTEWHGEGVAIDSSFGVELREFYVHDAAWAQPGGGGYAISLSAASSELLIENGIVVRANKLMVARSAGAGSVVGYNYMDMGYINTKGDWIEVGLNASHMVGSHHVLFEGNESQNADSDDTHGNSIDLTFLRNHLACIRAPFQNQAGGLIDDQLSDENKPKRCAGLTAYSYGMSFLGNVLGNKGAMGGYVYETEFIKGVPGIWMLGWDPIEPYAIDQRVVAETIRHGNFDFLTGTVRFDPAIADHNLPVSLYLTAKPKFFDSGRGYVWPWVDPSAPEKLHELPAKVRYDAGTPFVQP